MLQRGAPKLGKDGKPMKDKHGKVIYEPYRIKVLNTINFRKSMHYNPFAYIHSEKDILKLVTTLIANTKGEGKAGDDFWVKAETLLYCALIGYIHYEAPVEEQNFSTLIEFINAMEVREDDEEFKNPVDLMFDALEAEKPNHFAVRQYKKYKLAAGKTAKSILISCGARLAVFDIAELREVTAYDELELDTLGDRKTALFLIMSDTDDSFNFLISMCYTQLFNLLCEKADDVYGGRLPVHVRCLIGKLLIIYGLFTFFCVPAGYLAGLLVRRVFGDTYWYLTAVEVVGFAGMMAGGVIMSTWGGFKHRGKTLAVGLFAFGSFAIGMGFSKNFIFYLGLMVCYGVALTMVQTAITTMLQEKTDTSMQGRVFGLLGTMYAGFLPIGMAMFGPLADILPLQWIMIGSGIALIVIAGIAYYSRELKTI